MYCAYAWLMGEVDAKKMKRRVKLGYEGFWHDYLSRYDELGLKHYIRIAETLLEGVDVKGKRVLDVGCGTGILSLLVLSKGASQVTGIDFSHYMVMRAKDKAEKFGYNEKQADFYEADAEQLPFKDNSFDCVVSNMMIGLVLDQKKAIDEMVRVTRPGGNIAVSTHGYQQYWEAVEVISRIIFTRYGLVPYRPEYWPRSEKELKQLFSQTSLTDIKMRRVLNKEFFGSGAEAFDFFAAVSSLWWYARFPSYKWAEYMKEDRKVFERRGIKSYTFDVLFASGSK